MRSCRACAAAATAAFSTCPSILGHVSLPDRTAYSSAKSAILGFTRAGTGARCGGHHREQPESGAFRHGDEHRGHEQSGRQPPFLVSRRLGGGARWRRLGRSPATCVRTWRASLPVTSSSSMADGRRSKAMRATLLAIALLTCCCPPRCSLRVSRLRVRARGSPRARASFWDWVRTRRCAAASAARRCMPPIAGSWSRPARARCGRIEAPSIRRWCSRISTAAQLAEFLKRRATGERHAGLCDVERRAAQGQKVLEAHRLAEASSRNRAEREPAKTQSRLLVASATSNA